MNATNSWHWNILHGIIRLKTISGSRNYVRLLCISYSTFAVVSSSDSMMMTVMVTATVVVFGTHPTCHNGCLQSGHCPNWMMHLRRHCPWKMCEQGVMRAVRRRMSSKQTGQAVSPRSVICCNVASGKGAITARCIARGFQYWSSTCSPHT
jgi:hypothetical protein